MTWRWDPIHEEFSLGVVLLRPAGREGITLVAPNGFVSLTFDQLHQLHQLSCRYWRTRAWGPELLPGVEHVKPEVTR